MASKGWMSGTWNVLDLLVVRPIRRLLSSVDVTPTSVRIRNFPWRTRSIPREEVARFDLLDEPVEPPDYRRVGALLLIDGRSVVIWALTENRPGTVTELNNRLLEPRQASPTG